MFTDRLSSARIITRHFLSASSLMMRSFVSTRSLVHGGHPLAGWHKHSQAIALPTHEAGVSAQAEAINPATLSRRVWALALPAIGEQVLALLVGLSDTFLTGHLSTQAMAQLGYGRADAVAGVGAAGMITWVVLTLFFAVGVGATALVARAVGAKDRGLGTRSAGQALILGALSGILLTVVALPLVRVVIDVIGVQGTVADLAAAFLRIFALGLPAVGVAYAANASMRGSGDTRRPLIVMMVVNGTNIAASWLLMNGLPGLGIPALGVIGSACGAAAGWTLGAALAVFFLTRQHPVSPRITRAAMRPDRIVMWRILRIGLPSAAELFVLQFGVVAFSRFVVDLGAAVYAANTTINNLESIGTLPGLGFAVAATTLVGQALGAENPELARRSAWAALRPCFVFMLCMGLCAAFLPQLLLNLFVADAGVVQAGTWALRFSLLTLPALSVSFICNGSLRGAGDTKFPVVVRAAGTWGVRLPLALLLIPIFGLIGARLAMAGDFWMQAGLASWRFRSGDWRKAKV
ncbi:MAG TPA: MATE family efflux transporter [Ktedonobacterales bacterium]|jgi:putative MATE family efflux protein